MSNYVEEGHLLYIAYVDTYFLCYLNLDPWQLLVGSPPLLVLFAATQPIFLSRLLLILLGAKFKKLYCLPSCARTS